MNQTNTTIDNLKALRGRELVMALFEAGMAERMFKYQLEPLGFEIIDDHNPNYISLVSMNNLKIKGLDLCWSDCWQYNYNAISEHRQKLNHEIIASVFHPSRIANWIGCGNALEEYLA